MGVLSVNDFEMRSRRGAHQSAPYSPKSGPWHAWETPYRPFPKVVKEAVIEQDRHFRFIQLRRLSVEKGKVIATQPTPTDTTAVDPASTELRTAGATDDTPTESSQALKVRQKPQWWRQRLLGKGYPEMVAVATPREGLCHCWGCCRSRA